MGRLSNEELLEKEYISNEVFESERDELVSDWFIPYKLQCTVIMKSFIRFCCEDWDNVKSFLEEAKLLEQFERELNEKIYEVYDDDIKEAAKDDEADRENIKSLKHEYDVFRGE